MRFLSLITRPGVAKMLHCTNRLAMLQRKIAQKQRVLAELTILVIDVAAPQDSSKAVLLIELAILANEVAAPTSG